MPIDDPSTSVYLSVTLRDPVIPFPTIRSYGPAAAMLSVCLFYYLYCVSQRWGDPLLDLHGFPPDSDGDQRLLHGGKSDKVGV